MNENKLTAAQLEALAPYERHFTKATEAAWCPYPGQQGIDLMLRTWEELTGHRYGYKPGCPNCLLNLVRDLGTIYFAQKAPSVPAEAPTAPKASKTTPAKKNAPKTKK